MAKNTTQQIEQCFHCGNKVNMNFLFSQHEKFGGTYVNERGILDNDLEEHLYWIMLLCPVCRHVTVLKKYTNECYFNPENDEQYFEKEIIFPLNSYDLRHVSKSISDSFEAALKIKNIDKDLCLVALRKTLEMICDEKSANGNRLDKKVQDLINRQIFPKDFEAAFWIIRYAGNKAAHTNKISLQNYELDEIINMLYTIINYLYIMPGKMKMLKDKLENSNK